MTSTYLVSPVAMVISPGRVMSVLLPSDSTMVVFRVFSASWATSLRVMAALRAESMPSYRPMLLACLMVATCQSVPKSLANWK